MPELIQNSEHLDKRDTHLNPWYELIQELLPKIGWEQEEIKHMFPNPIPNDIEFNDNGRAWYKLSEDDKQILENYVYLWRYLGRPVQELPSKSTERKLKLAELQDLFKQMLTAKYLVISCNPVDKLLASTNQPWGSCISLDSDYSSGYSYNLPTLFPQQSMLTCFLTKGEYGNYGLKGRQFKTIKMKARCFIYLLQNERIGIGRVYPAQHSYHYGFMLFEELIKNAGFKTTKPIINPNHPIIGTEWNNEGFLLKYPFLTFKDNDGTTRSTYLDNINKSHHNDEPAKYHASSANFSNDIETDGTTLSEFINGDYKNMEDIYSYEDYDDDDYDDDDYEDDDY